MAFGWCELYDDFVFWLEQVGYHVTGLPQWQPAAPVHVIADPANGCFWLRKTSVKRMRDMESGKIRARSVPMAKIRQRYTLVNIEAVDVQKFARARALGMT